MRGSAAIAAMVVKAPMRKLPVGAPMHADRVGRGDDIDQRSRRDAAAPPFGEIGAGGAEFRACGGGHGCRRHAAALPLSAAIEAVGPDRQFGQPDAGRVADGVGDRRRRRHGRDLADADAAAEHVIETRLRRNARR